MKRRKGPESHDYYARLEEEPEPEEELEEE